MIDSLIEYLNPKKGLERARTRYALEQIRKFEAASSTDRNKGWGTIGGSADAIIAPALHKLRLRVRELIANDGLAKKAKHSLGSLLVGNGIKGQVQGNTKGDDKFNDVYDAWAESTHCDFDGMTNLYGLQFLIAITLVESGACIILKEVTPRSERKPGVVPLEIRVLEPDYVDLHRTEGMRKGNVIKNGVEFNKRGKVVARWLFKNHPGDNYPLVKDNYQSVRVPVEDMQYVMIRERPEQYHGVPWLTAVAMVFKDYGEFEEAQLLRQKIAACFAMFLEDIDVPEVETSGKMKPGFYSKMNPGTIEVLPAGRKASFLAPPGVEGYGEYTRGQKLRMSAGCLLTFESLTNDLSNVNFSSARIGQQDMYRNLDVIILTSLIPQVCVTIKNWFCVIAYLSNFIDKPFYKMTWTPAVRPFLEPVKDTKAAIMKMDAGLESVFATLRARGHNPKKYLSKLKKEVEYLRTLGLNLQLNLLQGNIEIVEQDIKNGGTKSVNATNNNNS